MIDRIMKMINVILNRRALKGNRVLIGRSLSINGRIYIIGNNIIIGDSVRINSSYKFNPIGGDVRTMLITHNDGRITIGNNVGISNSTIVAKQSVTIEDHVLIGGSCKIYDTDFHSLEYDYRMQKPDMHIKSAPVLIKNGAFIGAHSIILKGITIGEKSIVGAGSVVTKDIPDGEIWAGNPAKFIRKVEDGTQ